MATATATKSPIAELQALGQSVWLDNISREILNNGALRRLIEEDGLQGVTSNPTIFEKAIGHSSDYDDAIKKAVAAGADADAVYEKLTVADIQEALDLFRPLYDRTHGEHGYREPRSFAALGARDSRHDSRGQEAVGYAEASQRDDQDPRHARGSVGDRGIADGRDQRQRHATVQRRGVRGGRTRLHPRAQATSGRRDSRSTGSRRSRASSFRASTLRSTSGSTRS